MEGVVFVIEDDPGVRETLLSLIRGRGVRARGFTDGEDFFDRLPDVRHACVVTDLVMPRMDGLTVVRRLADRPGPAWPVVVVTGHVDVATAVTLMKAGVSDVIEKPFAAERLLQAVETGLATLARYDAQEKERAAVQARLAALTPREQEVFAALVEGLSNKQIAQRLNLSPRTVEIFRAKTMTKMQADSLAALVRMGLTVGT